MVNFEPGKQDVKVILDPGKLFLKRFPDYLDFNFYRGTGTKKEYLR